MHRLLWRAGFIRDARGDTWSLSKMLVAVTWLPLAALALAERASSGKWPEVATDVSVHTRLLIALPLMLLGETAMEHRCARVVAHVVKNELVPREETAEVAKLATRAETARDAILPELILLIAALAVGVLTLLGVLGPGGPLESLAQLRDVRSSRLWYAIVALPIFHFFTARSIWRWILWTWLLSRVARLHVQPMPTHPDKAGGLQCLAAPTVAIALVLMGVSAVVSGVWATDVLDASAQLTSFGSSAAALLIASVAVAFGPLLMFSGHLYRARIRALREYSEFSLTVTRQFHERWISRGTADASVLGSGDISALTDLAGNFESVARTRLVPFGPRAVLVVVAAVIAPMVPLVAIEFPLLELASHIGKALLGGRLPG